MGHERFTSDHFYERRVVSLHGESGGLKIRRERVGTGTTHLAPWSKGYDASPSSWKRWVQFPQVLFICFVRQIGYATGLSSLRCSVQIRHEVLPEREGNTT